MEMLFNNIVPDIIWRHEIPCPTDNACVTIQLSPPRCFASLGRGSELVKSPSFHDVAMSCSDVLKRDEDGNRLVLRTSNCQLDNEETFILTYVYFGDW